MRRNSERQSGRNELSPHRGFSLIELLIVVAIILIIAAIAVPNLLRSRLAANEASAVSSLHQVITASATFYTTYADGYPPSLAAIGTTGTAAVGCSNAQMIDSVLTAGSKSGYTFVMGPGVNAVVAANVPAGCTAGWQDGYTITATPVSMGSSGQRAFCADATGVIRNDINGIATVTAPYCSATMLSLN